jgi:hypothetical protein
VRLFINNVEVQTGQVLRVVKPATPVSYKISGIHNVEPSWDNLPLLNRYHHLLLVENQME